MVAGFVLACGACSKRQEPPPPTPVPKAPAAAPARPQEVEYRHTAGQPIAPVVVAEDPEPGAAAPVAAPSGNRAAPSINGDPNGLTRDALNRAIQGAMGALPSCFSSMTQDPAVSVSFEAAPSGRPSMLRVSGAPPDADRCIRNIVEGIRFPPFEGKGVQVDLPLSFHRVSRPTQTQAAAQQPAAPPLYLEP